MRPIDRLWYGDGSAARVVRAMLAPAAALYGVGSDARNALYDRGRLRVEAAMLPSVSIGNLAVGGTGKTPVAAWFAAELVKGGARPAVVLRGYGGDEPLVHAVLNPGVNVVVDADRVRGMDRARRSGCDVVVLDDAFQHRRAPRLEDVVLVSADRWHQPQRRLPAGPWREPVSSLARASLVMVTRKAATAAAATALAEQLAGATRTGAAAVASLQLDDVRSLHDDRTVALETLRGQRLLLIAGIGDPDALATQLRVAGATVDVAAYPDHHRYTDIDAARLAARAERYDSTVCTLKDAVKLHAAWPRQAPRLRYVSLRCDLEHGAGAVTAVVRRLLEARPTIKPGTAV